MGILDILQADDTAKDEFGQTQADRRQPLWSGLIKAGLLGVAAGGDLMPAERARMVGQMGGAIGDIPKEMMDYRSSAAQQTLRGQQVATAKTKMDNIAKLQALSKSPEFLESIKDLKPHEKIAMQAAIDAGDIDAFAKISGQVGAGAYKDQQLDIARQARLTAEERAKTAEEKASQPQISGNLVRTKDGSVVNALTRRVVLGPDGKPPPGAADDTFDPAKPNVGGTERLDMSALQGQSHDIAVQALRVARGEVAPPTTRSNPDAAVINEMAAKIAGPNGTSFGARQNFEKSLTSGDLNKTVIAPWSASMQHGQEAQEAFDDLANADGGKYAQLMNKARNTWGSIRDPEIQRKIARYDRAMANYVKESEKLIAGSGQITDAVRAEVAPLSDPNKTPAQQVGIMQAMISQSHARLAQPIQNARTLRHDSTVDMNNIGLSPEGMKSYQWLNDRLQKGPGTSAGNAGRGPTGKTPDGKPVYTHSDGKQYLEPE